MESPPVGVRRSNARTCPHKRTYSTWALAREAAKRTRRERHDKVHPYKCRGCSQYHVGGVPELDW